MSDSYWISSRSPSPDLAMNASYWDSATANTVYSTGNSSRQMSMTSVSSTSAVSNPSMTSANNSDRLPSLTSANSVLKQQSMTSQSRYSTQSEAQSSANRPSKQGIDSSTGNDSRDPRQREQSRDPRRRKRPSSSSITLAVPSKQRELPPDRPGNITADNIELHRLNHENELEWTLRRQFLLEHCESVDSAMLECLSQVFINMECYGATYPSAVMTRVREMSTDLSEDVAKVKRSDGIKFVKETDTKKPVNNRGKDSGLCHKPVAFVKPNTADRKEMDVSEESPQPDAEASTSGIITLPPGAKNTEKKSKLKYKQKREKAIVTIESIQERKRQYATSRMEEKIYDLSDALTQLLQDIEPNKSRNSIETMYIAANRTKLALDYSHELSGRKSSHLAFVSVDSVVLGCGEGTNKRVSKHAAFEDAINRLSKPYFRVVRVNPEKQEVESSDEPFTAVTKDSGFAVLGGGEVARRGMKPSQKPQKLDRNDFILIDYSNKQEINAATMLQQSADFNKVQIKWEFEDNSDHSTTCRLVLDHEEFESFTAATSKLAKINVAEKAVEKLQSTNWTMKVKEGADTKESGLSRDEVLGEMSQETEKLPDSNIGSKLLKKMGWTGGGVGKDGQGIAEPIKADTTLVRREGLGMSSAKGVSSDFKRKMKAVLVDYCKSRHDDLQFTPEFSSEERAFIHCEARKLGLRSKSYSQGEDRYLVVGRKRTAVQLFSHIMAQGGSTSKYELVAPHTSKSVTNE